MTQPNTYGLMSQRTQAFAMLEMLDHAHPVNVLSMFAEIMPIPRNKAETVKWRRRLPWDAVAAPLQEGVTPAGRQMRFEDVTLTLQQWGEVAPFTDKIVDLSEDAVVKEMVSEAGENAGRTLEQVTYNILKGGTSVFYANGFSRAVVNTAINLNRIRQIARFFLAMKAKTYRSVLAPSANIDIQNIEAAYIVVCHTDLAADIRNLPGFVKTVEYSQREVICPEEIGSVEEFRFVLSPDLKSFPNAGGAAAGAFVSTGGAQCDVYPMLFLAKNSYGVTPLKTNGKTGGKGNQPLTPILVNPTSNSSDPLAQRGWVGWKTYFNAVRLNETWMARCEVAASALA